MRGKLFVIQSEPPKAAKRRIPLGRLDYLPRLDLKPRLYVIPIIAETPHRGASTGFRLRLDATPSSS